MNIKTAPGVFDILPLPPAKDSWRTSSLWQWVEEKIRHQTRLFGYHEIRTPLIEQASLFTRSVGQTSDIVSKEMYLFEDKGGRTLALRPEGTAPVVRAIIEHSLHLQPFSQKLFYLSPMFRYERAQAGRYRQHHQFGVEAIGKAVPEQDAEVISLLMSCLAQIGLQGCQLKINSLGDTAARTRYRQLLLDHFESNQEQLSEDSKKRLIQNPLRILDSKEPCDQPLIETAPKLLDQIDEEQRCYFERVLKLLELLEIPYTIDKRLVRGLDYYTGVVFEVTSSLLGAQNSLGGGGRYDGLIKELGGPQLPAVGFGAGLERIIQSLIAQKQLQPTTSSITAYLIALGEEAARSAFQLLQKLRQADIACEMAFGMSKLNKMLEQANKLQARYCLIIGEEELNRSCCQLKEMQSGESKMIPLCDVVDILTRNK